MGGTYIEYTRDLPARVPARGRFFVIRAQAKDLTDTHLLAQTKMRNPARSLLRNRPERTKHRQMALPGRSKKFSKK